MRTTFLRIIGLTLILIGCLIAIAGVKLNPAFSAIGTAASGGRDVSNATEDMLSGVSDSMKSWEGTLDQFDATFVAVTDAWSRISTEMPGVAHTMESVAEKCDASAFKIHSFGDTIGSIYIPTGITLTDMHVPMIGAVKIKPELVTKKMTDEWCPGLDDQVRGIAQDAWNIKGSLKVYASVMKSFGPEYDTVGPLLAKSRMSTAMTKHELILLRTDRLAKLAVAVHRTSTGLNGIATLAGWLTALVVLTGCGFAMIGALVLVNLRGQAEPVHRSS